MQQLHSLYKIISIELFIESIENIIIPYFMTMAHKIELHKSFQPYFSNLLIY